MSSKDRDRLMGVARQELRTGVHFGVDFVPITRLGHARVIDQSHEATGDHEAVADDTVRALAVLQENHDAGCPHCTSATAHTRTVFGEGDPNADLMFIGEAPGEQEDRTGRPFVGRAGQKLDEIIAAMGLDRSQVYIANILKSRPPNNRTPLLHEVEACAPFLMKQIRIIRPRVIVALGGPAAKFLLRTDEGITRLRGQWGILEDPDSNLKVPIMPTFHPAYLLRNYTPDTRKKVWSDMQAVLKKLSERSKDR